jgi:hypothetical protein
VAKRYRFTGENPPPKLWRRYPNWQYALDEEDIPDQDETTIRPADNQQTIDEYVCLTAGDAVLASGRTVPALLALDSGESYSVDVYPDPTQDDWWMLRFDAPYNKWFAMNDDQFLQRPCILPVPLDKPGVFPLRVTSRLPLDSSGEPIVIEVDRPG